MQGYYCILNDVWRPESGGKGVLEAMEKQLGLTPEHMWPSKYALWRYGNTSSSSIWYTLHGSKHLIPIHHKSQPGLET